MRPSPWAAALFIVSAASLPGRAADYCVAIEPHALAGERISVIDLVLEHATLVSIPKYPVGWQMEIRQEIEGDTVVFGAALGGVAELDPRELHCLFQVERSFNDQSIRMVGHGSISFGIEPQRHAVLRDDQVRFRKIDAK